MGKPCWGFQLSCSSPEADRISLASCCFFSFCFPVIWQNRRHHERSIEKEVRRAGGWQHLLLLLLLLPPLLLSILRLGHRWGEFPWRAQAQLCLNIQLHPWVPQALPGSAMALHGVFVGWWWVSTPQRPPWGTPLWVEVAVVPAACHDTDLQPSNLLTGVFLSPSLQYFLFLWNGFAEVHVSRNGNPRMGVQRHVGASQPVLQDHPTNPQFPVKLFHRQNLIRQWRPVMLFFKND